MKLFSAKAMMKRRDYRATRMRELRSDISGWLQEYETAKTAKHRKVCMEQVQMELRKYQWYGDR